MKVRTNLLVAVAAISIATPAVARDGAPYFGVELGASIVEDGDLEYQGITGTFDGDVGVDHKTGFDGDLIGGYDFGMIRAELEIAYKKAKIDETTLATNIGPALGEGGKARSVSAMVNALLDFGDDDGWSGYVGGGIGVARTTYKVDAISFGATDGNLAWQAIAGVRTAITPNIDLGVKYRFYNTKFNVEETDVEELSGKFRSHSLLPA